MSQLHWCSCLWVPNLATKIFATNGNPWKGIAPAWLMGWPISAAIRIKHPFTSRRSKSDLESAGYNKSGFPKHCFYSAHTLRTSRAKKQLSHMAEGLCWVRLSVSTALADYRRPGSKAQKFGGLDLWIQSSWALGASWKSTCIRTQDVLPKQFGLSSLEIYKAKNSPRGKCLPGHRTFGGVRVAGWQACWFSAGNSVCGVGKDTQNTCLTPSWSPGFFFFFSSPI